VKRVRIGQAVAICLLGLALAVAAMALFVHGEALVSGRQMPSAILWEVPEPPEISLIATDLDGTLWDAEGRIDPRTKSALTQLAEQGIPVLAATARRPGSALDVMRKNEILLPAVLLDGSLGRDFDSATTFQCHCFDLDSAAAVFASLVASGIEPCVNVDHPTRDVVVGDSPSTNPGHLAFIEPWRRRGELSTVVTTESVLSFVVCGLDRKWLVDAKGALGGLAAATVSRDLQWGNYTLSVRPPGVNKWQGVVAYCDVYGIDSSRVLAVGDGENDISLLTSAAVSCAVGTACEAVLAIADYCLGDPGNPGWYSIVDKVI
jgi:hydroxymethylpyrimidine pyrophosphatase-like HAD family hydrolase